MRRWNTPHIVTFISRETGNEFEQTVSDKSLLANSNHAKFEQVIAAQSRVLTELIELAEKREAEGFPIR